MPRTTRHGDGDPPGDLVGRLDAEVTRTLLVRAAEDHDDVARAVRLAAAGPADRLGVLRREVDRGLRTRRYLGYRESAEWAQEAEPVVDAVAEAVAMEPSRELVALLERAVGHVVKVILRADDSDGLIGGLAQRLLDLHERACAAGAAEPVALARWMVRFTFEDQDFFMVDPIHYADALGDEGLAAYRKEVAKRSAGPDRFAASYTAERLAVLNGDVDRVVELHGGDLTGPHQFIRVAEAMLELGREDDVLAWARRGIAETTGWQVAKLYDLAADVLAHRRDTTSVSELRREQHQRMPSSSTYSLLQGAAEAVGAWEAEREAARAVLAARDRGGLVDVLLADGEVDGAWSVATEGGWDPGENRWRRLAGAREPTDPAAAMGVYLRLTDAVLVQADRRAYRDAVRHLKAARRAAVAADQSTDFEHRLAALRDQHRRRPTLISMLDKAGLQ
jgi:hypothetical protein